MSRLLYRYANNYKDIFCKYVLSNLYIQRTRQYRRLYYAIYEVTMKSLDISYLVFLETHSEEYMKLVLISLK